MLVVAAGVPGIERVETNDVQSLVRKCGLVVLKEAKQIFVVSPGHHQVLHAAVGFVHSVLGAE